MFKKIIPSMALIAIFLIACSSETPAVEPEAPATEPEVAPLSQADLDAVKQYTLNNAHEMKAGTAALLTSAQAYHELIAAYDFDYEAAWAAEAETLIQQTTDLKNQWVTASQYYELDEGIVAGVPSLAFYDVWIDAGPSAEEDPAEAYEWTLELPDGTTLESPGNFFHSILEPTIWGTKPEFTGIPADFNGDGQLVIGEALPNANVLLGAAEGLDNATAKMVSAIEGWEPTTSDAFTALVVMIPTMNEYFEQWKLSAYVSGEAAEETAFIGASRLFDITSILNGLDVTYQNVSVLVESTDTNLNAQINDGFNDLRTYVDDLYTQEQNGTTFTAEQADLFGTEAQAKATALSGQVAQAAALLEVEIAE